MRIVLDYQLTNEHIKHGDVTISLVTNLIAERTICSAKDDVKMLQINSKQKSLGKVFKGISLAMLCIAIYLVWPALFASASESTWLAVFCFFGFACLCLGIGSYQQKKFDKLGETPLILSSQKCKIGEVLSGKIRVNKARFSKVSQVSLTNVYYDGRYREVGRFKKLQTTQCPCEKTFENDVTWLTFSIEVPTNGRPTKDLRNRRFYWEVSIEFTEQMTLYKRTWPVEILPLDETLIMV